MIVKDLGSMYNAVRHHEREISLYGKGFEELCILLAKDNNALKNIAKGAGKSVLLQAGGIAAMFTGAFVLPLALVGAGIARLGKAATYDVIKGSIDDKKLMNSKKQIISKYSGVNFKHFGEMLYKHYKVTSEGNSHVIFTHK